MSLSHVACWETRSTTQLVVVNRGVLIPAGHFKLVAVSIAVGGPTQDRLCRLQREGLPSLSTAAAAAAAAAAGMTATKRHTPSTFISHEHGAPINMLRSLSEQV